MSTTSQALRSERGATLILVAVAMTALLGFLALAIDLGMLYTARADAQRAADAAALAGASAFLDNSASAAVTPARQRAFEYAERNTFQNGPIDSTNIVVTVLQDSGKVGVYIHRDSVATLFARVLGIRTVPISAFAAAQAVQAGAAKCLKPIAIPDLWSDANSDQNGDRVMDNGEQWTFGDNAGDRYEAFNGTNAATATGYGGGFRNSTSPGSPDDFGRQIQIKEQDPNSPYVANPGVFYPWQIPTDPSMSTCKGGFGGGAAAYRNNLCSCNNSSVTLGQSYPIETGNMVGPTFQGVGELIKDDPSAYWDPSTQTVKGSTFGGSWMNSPRVVKLALFEPGQITKSGMTTIKFNNFALMFIESQPNNKAPVTGRFLYYVSGSGDPGPQTGSLVKTLKLVK
jgi:Flp pilus assembly protein TadG